MSFYYTTKQRPITMAFSNNYNRFFLLAILFVLSDFCFCMEFNASLADNGFGPAVATWYGDPTGSGGGGACGFNDDVANPPYYGMISAGNQNLFRSGAGCGTCYQVKCTENPKCSGSPIIVTISDECPGACNNEPFHFDLSGKAFGALAKSGQADALRQAGRINIQYERVNCRYNSKIAFKVAVGSNKYYLELVVQNVNGVGEIGHIEILIRGSWVSMKRDFGEAWNVGIPEGASGPYSVKVTDTSNKSVMADRVIPANWTPLQTYYSGVNF